jgi:hypothetical protein
MSHERKAGCRGAALLGLVVILTTGCGKAPPTEAYVPDQSGVLAEVWDMYKSHVAARKRPPAKIDDLNPYEPAAIHGYGALNTGEVVLAYGGKPTPPQVLAYPKSVPQAGGPVLLADGSVKDMTATEFHSAPKAPGLK